MMLGFSPNAESPVYPTENLANTVWGLTTVSLPNPRIKLAPRINQMPITFTFDVGINKGYTFQVLETVIATSPVNIEYAATILELLQIHGEGNEALLALIDEVVGIVAAFTTSRRSTQSFADTVSANSTIMRILDAQLDDAALVDGLGIDSITRGLTIAESITALGEASAMVQALVDIQAQLLAEGHAFVGTEEMLEATVQAQAQADAYTRAVAALLDAITVDGVAEGHMALTMVLGDKITVTEDITIGGIFSAILRDGVEAYVTITANGETFTCWCTNAENLASSEYRDYDFDSIVIVGGLPYASGAGGIYALEGDTDSGRPIRASVLTGLLNFGSSALKHVPAGYVTRTTTGDMLMKVVTTSDGKKQVNTYTVKNTLTDTYRATQVRFGKGLRAKFWQFELSNVDGADFKVDELEMTPEVLLRRI